MSHVKRDPEQDKIHAAEAKQLRDTPAFQRAMLAAKQRCYAELAEVNPLYTEDIRVIQANIRAIDLLAEMLADEIIRGTPPRQIGVGMVA